MAQKNGFWCFQPFSHVFAPQKCIFSFFFGALREILRRFLGSAKSFHKRGRKRGCKCITFYIMHVCDVKEEKGRKYLNCGSKKGCGRDTVCSVVWGSQTNATTLFTSWFMFEVLCRTHEKTIFLIRSANVVIALHAVLLLHGIDLRTNCLMAN